MDWGPDGVVWSGRMAVWVSGMTSEAVVLAAEEMGSEVGERKVSPVEGGRVPREVVSPLTGSVDGRSPLPLPFPFPLPLPLPLPLTLTEGVISAPAGRETGHVSVVLRGSDTRQGSHD